MHPRNAYGTPPDLGALAMRDARVRPYVTEHGPHATVAWEEPAAVRAITSALLREDFGIEATLPLNRLCPTLPNRVNYLLWVEDLVHALHPHDCANATEARGIDLGTGCVAIYACLACAMHRRWTMVGTDIDEAALAHAADVVQNVANNDVDCVRGPCHGPLRLRARITLKRTHGALLEGVPEDHGAAAAGPLGAPAFHFTVCNPPFYASPDERRASAAGKQVARRWSAGTAHEMYTPGGEVGWALQLLRESHATRGTVAYVGC